MAVHYLHITFRILSNQVSDSIFYLEGVCTTFIVKNGDSFNQSFSFICITCLNDRTILKPSHENKQSTGVVLSRSSPFQNLQDKRQQQQQASQANVMHNNDVFTSINCKLGEWVR